MSVAKIVEISAASPNGFDDAIRTGIARASKTIKGIKGAWVAEQKVVVDNGNVTNFRVTMKVSFILAD